jgi:hypothetical protein
VTRNRPEIFCPKCNWRPKPSSRWCCTPQFGGCGQIWNTFDTRGVCPKCSWKWIITACLFCQQFSPHEEWYHELIGESDRALEEEQVLEEA